MDLSEPEEGKALKKEQLVALDKMALAEEEYLKAMKSIANNLLVNNDTYRQAREHVILATMLFRRAISKPNEK